ncbi:hypothetical protein PS417_25155 [Pseudomonas simiae]|uniref:Uncharacterized protein n=1 Tax=Pseudomonas simiae TaxID=321846 RepID=A0A1N7U4E1_9PSED|nr:hypothetical protein PS417_25155 [Pseudomonas simiae]
MFLYFPACVPLFRQQREVLRKKLQKLDMEHRNYHLRDNIIVIFRKTTVMVVTALKTLRVKRHTKKQVVKTGSVKGYLIFGVLTPRI